jgi:hypothetical protein
MSAAEEVLAEITQRALVQKSPLAPTETDAAAPCRTARPSRRQARKTEAAMNASSNTEYAPDGAPMKCWPLILRAAFSIVHSNKSTRTGNTAAAGALRARVERQLKRAWLRYSHGSYAASKGPPFQAPANQPHWSNTHVREQSHPGRQFRFGWTRFHQIRTQSPLLRLKLYLPYRELQSIAAL